MKQSLLATASLIVGFTAGYFIGYKLTKKKYENLADEEVESVKRSFEKIQIKDNPIKKETHKKPAIGVKETPSFTDEDKKEYIDYSKQYRTESADNRIAGKPIDKKEVPKEPYLITPDEFSESYYESKTLFYYADKVITDDDYNLINDPKELLGEDALGKFGIYEDDAIHIRDDSKMIDYEILLDERYYKKIKSYIKPKTLKQPDPETEDD